MILIYRFLSFFDIQINICYNRPCLYSLATSSWDLTFVILSSMAVRKLAILVCSAEQGQAISIDLRLLKEIFLSTARL